MKVGDNIELKGSSWSFGEEVVRSFDDHVKSSIPLYKEGHQLIQRLSDFFIRPDSLVYDLGCSTGTLLSSLAARRSEATIKFKGLDCESKMVEAAKQRHHHDPRLDFITADITGYEFERADLFISYYTLQFLRPEERSRILHRLFHSLNPGGALILFEKTRIESGNFADMFQELYHDFKRENGHSGEEILAKSRSLRGILRPNTSESIMQQLDQAGFTRRSLFVKYLAFEGIIAIKEGA